MIKERPRGLFDRIFPFAPDVDVPVNLDHTIPQPNGIIVHLQGNRDNVKVNIVTKRGTFSLNELNPAIRFLVSTSKFDHFSYNHRDRAVTIPPTREIQGNDVVLSLLHEMGHDASQRNQKWQDALQKARETLRNQLFSRAIDGYMWTSDDQTKREQERQSFALLLEEERRASAQAISQVRELRSEGVELIPHRKTTRDIARFFNEVLPRYEKIDFGVQVVRRKRGIADKLFGLSKRQNNKAVYIEPWQEYVKKNRLLSLRELGLWIIGMGVATTALFEIVQYWLQKPFDLPDGCIIGGSVGLMYGTLLYLSGGTYRPLK